MKKFIAMILVVALTAAISVGATMAYLTDTEEDVNVMTLGNVSIAQHEYERVVNADGTYATATIDNQTSYVLKEFSQAKPLYPATEVDANGNPYNFGAGDWDTTTVRMSQVDSQGGLQMFSNANAQDKIVTVENTGKSDAYVRVLYAFEIGSVAFADFNSVIRTGSFMSADGVWSSTVVGIVEIDGNNYVLEEAIYYGGAHLGGVHANGVLPAGETTYADLCQVYMTATSTNEDVEAIDGNGNGCYDILVITQAVQTAGFENAKTALDTAFGAANEANAKAWFEEIGVSDPSDDDEFEDAVTGNDKAIIVNLSADVTYDIAAWDAESMGGADTEKIVINGNGHTITFNQTNSDWTNIVTNGATLIINNATITNAGPDATSGTREGHNITFNCPVVLNHVVSLNSITVEQDATFTDVKITDDSTGDSYMLWVAAKGQTVTLDNCVIDATGTNGNDRGIKVDAQYISAPEKVTLVVKNTSFATESKAAILVDTPAGADITLENVNITGVAADSTNPVWVDGDAASFADLVTVTGGSVIIEP